MNKLREMANAGKHTLGTFVELRGANVEKPQNTNEKDFIE